MTDLTAKIDALADARDRLTALRLDWEAQRDRILAPLRAELADLDAEYAPLLEIAQDAAATLEAEIRAAVLAAGATAKGSRLQVVWMKGRESIDMKAIKGYAVAHPEVRQFIKENEPTVSIRSI